MMYITRLILFFFILPIIGSTIETENIPQAVTISEVINAGQYVMLSDNTIWEIKPEDYPIAGGWIAPGTIKISASNNANYPFVLYNQLTHDKVLAKKTTLQSIHKRKSNDNKIPLKKNQKN